MKNTAENRKNRRIVFNEQIQYEYCETLSGRFVNGLNSGEAVDLSDGGIGLRTGGAFKSGDVLKLFIPVEAGQANVPVYSLVVWVKAINGHFQAGLRFLT